MPPEPRSPAAEEGTLAHEIAALVLSGQGYQQVITDEMLDAVTAYHNYVLNVTGTSRNLMIERPVKIPSIHKDCWGTPDCWWYDTETRTLHVFDFKYGFGVVEAFENWQLLTYACGLVHLGEMDNVVLHISQPRAWHEVGPNRSWRLSVGELLGEYGERIRQAVAAALAPNPTCTTGPHCRYCPALLSCNTAATAAMWAIEVCETMNLSEITPETVGPQFAILKRASEIIGHRLIKAEEMGLQMIKGGAMIPGLTVRNTRGSTRWDAEPEALFNTGDMLGVDLRKPAAPVTPNQAIKAGIPAQIVNNLSTKYPGKQKLFVDDGDKARRIFSRS